MGVSAAAGAGALVDVGGTGSDVAAVVGEVNDGVENVADVCEGRRGACRNGVWRGAAGEGSEGEPMGSGRGRHRSRPGGWRLGPCRS